MPRNPRFRLAAFLVFAAAVSACARAHDLDVESTTSSSSAATTTGSAGSGSGGSSSAGTGTGGTSEPSGPTRVTVVNGVNDYDAIRICFLPYPAGDPAAKPWPSVASGLLFAHAAVLDLAVDIPANTDVRPTIFAGDLTTIAGMSCDQALALAASSDEDAGTTAPILAAALAVLPASVFTSEKSLLLAPIGCLGGPGHDDVGAKVGCGDSYTSSTPTVNLLALGMSRKTDPVHVALQIVNASVAIQPTDFGITSSIMGSVNLPLATALPTGGIEPKPPFTALTVSELGAPEKVSIKTYVSGQAMMSTTSDTPMGEAFQNGTVASSQLANGGGYVLVAVGSAPNIPAGAFWHKLTYSLIKANP